MTSFKNILVSVDLSETSDRVLDFAIDLASKLGAEVTILHVYSLPVYNLPDGSFVPTAEVADSIARAAQKQLDATVARYVSLGVPVKGLLKNGSPQQEIVDVADDLGVDLIVMGTHGRGPFTRALLGSVATSIVRAAKQPVITIRNAESS